MLGFQSDQLSSLFRGASKTWSFVPQVTQPIFTAGRLKSNVKFARAQRELALASISKRFEQRSAKCRTLWFNIAERKRSERNRKLLVTTLQDRSRLAYLRYQGGVDTLLNALDADS